MITEITNHRIVNSNQRTYCACEKRRELSHKNRSVNSFQHAIFGVILKTSDFNLFFSASINTISIHFICTLAPNRHFGIQVFDLIAFA